MAVPPLSFSLPLSSLLFSLIHRRVYPDVPRGGVVGRLGEVRHQRLHACRCPSPQPAPDWSVDARGGPARGLGAVTTHEVLLLPQSPHEGEVQARRRGGQICGGSGGGGGGAIPSRKRRGRGRGGEGRPHHIFHDECARGHAQLENGRGLAAGKFGRTSACDVTHSLNPPLPSHPFTPSPLTHLHQHRPPLPPSPFSPFPSLFPFPSPFPFLLPFPPSSVLLSSSLVLPLPFPTSRHVSWCMHWLHQVPHQQPVGCVLP